MPRNRSFNEEEVLYKIMWTFWEQGYEATNLGHLEAATSLPRTSLYNAFGNKADIFAQILSLYHRVMEGHFAEVTAKPTMNSLVSVFEAMLDRQSEEGKKFPLGCLMVGAASQRSVLEERHIELVHSYRSMLVSRAHDILKINQEAGEINANINVAESAEFLVCVAWGALLTQCIDTGGSSVQSAVATLKQTCINWCTSPSVLV
ncbi:TetR/AcrR family transcriptional regulator [Thalassotalea montiporae]